MPRKLGQLALLPVFGMSAAAINLVWFGIIDGFAGWDWYVWPSGVASGGAVGSSTIILFRSDHPVAVTLRRALIGGFIGLMVCPFVLLVLPKLLHLRPMSSSGVTATGGNVYGPLVFVVLSIIGYSVGLLFGPFVPRLLRMFRGRSSGAP